MGWRRASTIWWIHADDIMRDVRRVTFRLECHRARLELTELAVGMRLPMVRTISFAIPKISATVAIVCNSIILRWQSTQIREFAKDILVFGYRRARAQEGFPRYCSDLEKGLPSRATCFQEAHGQASASSPRRQRNQLVMLLGLSRKANTLHLPRESSGISETIDNGEQGAGGTRRCLLGHGTDAAARLRRPPGDRRGPPRCPLGLRP